MRPVNEKTSRNKRARKLREKGLSYAQIGKLLGITRQMVYKIISRPVDTIHTHAVDSPKKKK